MRACFRNIAALLCVCAFLTAGARVCVADDLTETEMFFSQEEQFSGPVEVPGRGTMRYYAQNDPLWANLTYENPGVSSRRPFRDSACGPTAAAMAVAALVPESELQNISRFALRPYSLCPCSLNKAKCEGHHARYILTSDRDFLRFLPLVFGDFAAGNNTFGVNSRANTIGTNAGFLYHIATAYGLKVSTATDVKKALEAVQSGASVIATAGKGGVFTNTGHYVFLAWADEEKVYFLDPLCREKYETNQAKKLEIIRPGLVALTRENLGAARLGGFYIFTVAEESKSR